MGIMLLLKVSLQPGRHTKSIKNFFCNLQFIINWPYKESNIIGKQREPIKRAISSANKESRCPEILRERGLHNNIIKNIHNQNEQHWGQRIALPEATLVLNYPTRFPIQHDTSGRSIKQIRYQIAPSHTEAQMSQNFQEVGNGHPNSI